MAPGEPAIGGARYDYADAFEIRAAGPDARTAEDFARCAFEQAPPAVRWIIWTVHRHLVRFDLGRRGSPDHILGWRIVASGPDLIHVEAVSPLLRGVIVGRRVDSTTAVVTTYLFHRRSRLAAALWKAVGPLHRRIAPYLLTRAAASPVTTPDPAAVRP